MLMNISNPGVFQHSDWTRIQNTAKIIQQEIASGRWESKRTYDPAMYSDIYSFNKNGSISVSRTNDGTPWLFWNGAWLESLLPWTKIIRKKFSDAGFSISTIIYHWHTYSVLEHKDVAYNGEYPDLPHTNINYMISSQNPDTSYTWCRDDDGKEMRYYSHPGKLWLFNASNLHAVVTNGYRDALILKLRHPYSELEKLLTSNPNFFDVN